MMRLVSLMPLSDETYKVLEGLTEGEEVVTNGTFTVDAAAQLMGKKSMMNDQGTGTKESETDIKSPLKKLNSDGYFTSALTTLTGDYLSLKDALVAGDYKGGKEYASLMLEKINLIRPPAKDTEAGIYWEGKSRVMKEALTSLAATDLPAQREVFVGLSKEVIQLVKTFGITRGTLYIQFCPMANADAGAYWISDKKEIKNPYYGEAMITCGSTVETIY